MLPSSRSKNNTRGRKRTVSPTRKRLQLGGAETRKPLKIGENWEAQQSAGCGRHALNNLFGNTYFVEDDKSVITDETFLKLGKETPISLQSICRYLSKDEQFNQPDSDNKLVP